MLKRLVLPIYASGVKLMEPVATTGSLKVQEISQLLKKELNSMKQPNVNQILNKEVNLESINLVTGSATLLLKITGMCYPI